MSVAFCVTAYQEMDRSRKYGSRLLECIRPAQADDRIDEIVVVDDASDDFTELAMVLAGEPKVKLFRNEENLGVWGNKIEAILRSTCSWAISCDSDNRMDSTYVGVAAGLYLPSPDVRYCPTFARPEFDYHELAGRYTLKNISKIIDHPIFECAMNTGNLVTHRGMFEKVFGWYRRRPMHTALPNFLGVPTDRLKADGPKWEAVYNACDSFMFQLIWLLEGKAIEFVPGLEYDHYYTNGAESNYARAPAEKCDLSRAMKVYLRKVAS